MEKKKTNSIFHEKQKWEVGLTLNTLINYILIIYNMLKRELST